jgi:hypothetical protein
LSVAFDSISLLSQILGPNLTPNFGFPAKVRMYESQSAVHRGGQAYIDGYDIYFAPGAFQPNSASGRQIIEDILVELVRRMRAVEVTIIGMLSAPAACSARAATVASPAN